LKQQSDIIYELEKEDIPSKKGEEIIRQILIFEDIIYYVQNPNTTQPFPFKSQFQNPPSTI